MENVSVRGCDERSSPEGEFAFGTDAVCRKDEGAVCDGMSAHHRNPAVLLARVNFSRFGLHPTDSSGVDQNVCTLQAHNAGRFGEPLVPANQDTECTGARLDGFKARVARNKVVLFVKGRIVGNVALAVKACNRTVAFKDEGTVVVNAAGAFLEERENDNGVDFFRDALPLLYERAVFFDGHVEEVCIFFEREIRRMEHLGENDQVDSLALERKRLVHVPLVIGLAVARPLALQCCCLDFVHFANLCCSVLETNNLRY